MFPLLKAMAANVIGRFTQLERQGLIREVQMNDVQVQLPDGVIGTQNLNGCTAIAVLGRAIILAHIVPLPPHPLGASPNRKVEAGEGDDHFTRCLDAVRRLYDHNRELFPSRTTAWGIFGRYRGVVGMPEKLQIATQQFHKMGLPSRPAFYDVQPSDSPRRPGAGTVIGVAKDGMTYLYVEDEIKHSVNFNVAVNATPASVTSRQQGPAKYVMPSGSRAPDCVGNPRQLDQIACSTQERQFNQLRTECIERLATLVQAKMRLGTCWHIMQPAPSNAGSLKNPGVSCY
nr:hypothetical protein CFP56_71324 [Quercus suber]